MKPLIESRSLGWYIDKKSCLEDWQVDMIEQLICEGCQQKIRRKTRWFLRVIPDSYRFPWVDRITLEEYFDDMGAATHRYATYAAGQSYPDEMRRIRRDIAKRY